MVPGVATVWLEVVAVTAELPVEALSTCKGTVVELLRLPFVPVTVGE